MDIVDAFVDSTNTSIVNIIEENSFGEEPWDGFGGLVRIGDSAVFREEGLLTSLAPLHSCSSHDLHRLRSSKSRPLSSADSLRSTEEKKATPVKTETVVIEAAETQPNTNMETVGYDEDVSQNAVDDDKPTSVCKVDSVESKGSDKRSFVSVKSNRRSTEILSEPVQSKEQSVFYSKPVERVMSDVERFKSRLIAVRSEGLSAREAMIKCAAIAEDAFSLALKKLRSGHYLDAYLLAEVAESACPPTVVSAKNKIFKLKQSAQRRLTATPPLSVHNVI